MDIELRTKINRIYFETASEAGGDLAERRHKWEAAVIDRLEDLGYTVEIDPGVGPDPYEGTVGVYSGSVLLGWFDTFASGERHVERADALTDDVDAIEILDGILPLVVRQAAADWEAAVEAANAQLHKTD